MKIEWDENKNRSNVIKHGLNFEDAALVFSLPCVTFHDNRFDYGEQRFITLGLLGKGSVSGRLVVIAHVPRAGGTRIISMRKGNRREQAIYKNHINQERPEKA